MLYSITLRSRTDARITGGPTAAAAGGRPITTGRRSSTRKAMADPMPRIAQPLSPQSRGHQHRSNAGRSSVDIVPPMFSPSVKCQSKGKLWGRFRSRNLGQTQALAGRSIRGRWPYQPKSLSSVA